MKIFFHISLILYTGTFLHAQKKSFLSECKETEFQKKCTIEKIEADINNLVTQDMRKSMKAAGKEYFGVKTMFIIDENGKVIPSETRSLTDIESLKKPLENYVANLPLFVPKDSLEKERRELYMISLDYLIDKNRQDYHIADDWEMTLKDVKRDFIKLDEYPVYPGCEGVYDSDFKCLSSFMNKRISNKFRIPFNAPNGQVNMIVRIIISDDGKIEVDKIIGGSEDFQKEVKRIFQNLPKLIPAKISGIPLRTAFNLPITINVS